MVLDGHVSYPVPVQRCKNRSMIVFPLSFLLMIFRFLYRNIDVYSPLITCNVPLFAGLVECPYFDFDKDFLQLGGYSP